MLELPSLVFFVVTTLTLLIIPGPAVLYIISRSIDHGRRAGLAATFGIAAGTLVHIAAAAFGVSALLVSSVTLFNVVKYLGALYLIYLGVKRLRERDELEAPKIRDHASFGRIFRQGMVVNLLNPKTTLFFFAFLPQFVHVDRGHVALQILLLGLLFIALAFLNDSLWALLAARFRDWLRFHQGFLRAQRYVSGSILIGLGLVTAVSGAESKG